MRRGVRQDYNLSVLESRVKHILDCAAAEGVQVLILGAFGCGVFGQAPADVAMMFRWYLVDNPSYKFDKVVFAIPDKYSYNHIAFRNVLLGKRGSQNCGSSQGLSDKIQYYVDDPHFVDDTVYDYPDDSYSLEYDWIEQDVIDSMWYVAIIFIMMICIFGMLFF